MKRFFVQGLKVFLAVWLVSLTVQAQIVVLKGKVSDQNGDPLPYTKISERRLGVSSLSNEQGLFYLKVPHDQANLTLSYIGYMPLDTVLYFTGKEDTVRVSFRMQSSVKELGLITVSSKPYTQVFQTTDLNILDYSFFGQQVLLLVKSKEEYQIRLLDPQEKVLTQQNLKFKPVSFMRDCIGILHIVGEDSLYPVEFNSEIFAFPNAISMAEYRQYIAPCVGSNEGYFFLQQVTNFNQTIRYFSQRKADNYYRNMHSVSDPLKVQDVQNYARELDMAWAPDIMGDIYNPADIRASREKSQDQFFFNLVVTNATYAPLIRTENAVYIFDHLADTCFVFSQSALPLRQFAISYHRQETWGKKLILDEAREKIYAVHIHDGIFRLSEIDLETGQLKSGTDLTRHTYPEKIRVKNGWIYYLHHEMNRAGFNKLYKVRLADPH